LIFEIKIISNFIIMKDTERLYWALVSNDKESKILQGTHKDFHNNEFFAWSSLSCRYDTKEELIEAEGILDEPCKECGKIVSTNYLNETKEALIAGNICFKCHFWVSKLVIKDNPRTVRVDGTHYYIDDDKPRGSSFLGFGGAEFNIKFNDGRLVTSHNLWCQGDIPEHFKERLPDNAVFVQYRIKERDNILDNLIPGARNHE